ncbi:unnamed protein product [Adineta steineri]|uniref:Uncharacterized protein n=1 Tax=Adineta steineri TaxID=433720 RepID=A0A813SVF7_9BILA|nr:unnamed protein product [Adineta steineri]CAF3983388.1 unnamed protein product [Adineta steineri]
MDTDLMFNFRHGLLGRQHTVLKNKPDALLLQLVEDLNALQVNGISIPTLQTQLHFAFTVASSDHLASNGIGEFQKIFNTGEFCRHCHMNYN